MLAWLDIPVIVNLLFSKYIQISMSRPGNINVFQWHRNVLYSWFSVLTKDEVTLNRPKIAKGFSVICWFCLLRLFRFALNFSTEIFIHSLQVVPATEWVLGNRSLFPTILLFHLRLGKQTSFALILRGLISDASNVSKSSKSATKKSPFQIHRAISS